MKKMIPPSTFIINLLNPVNDRLLKCIMNQIKKERLKGDIGKRNNCRLNQYKNMPTKSGGIIIPI